MRGAATLVLDHDIARRREGTHLGRDIVSVGPDHQSDSSDAGGTDRRDRMRQHGATGDRVQDLGARGLHARPLAGGKHDGKTRARDVRTHDLLQHTPACGEWRCLST